jgi:hypothetical protein
MFPSFPFDRRLSRPQIRCGRNGEMKILEIAGTRIPTI